MVEIDIDSERCIGCGACVNACHVNLYEIVASKSKLTGDTDTCVLCRACETACPVGAITISE